MDIEELKPCPFCGSGVLHRNNPEKMGRTFFVSCGLCDCRGACLPTEQGAVDAWNTRADEFAAMARDAERWRYRQKLLKDGGQIWQTQGVFTLRDIKRDVIAMGTSEESAIDAAMAERNK